MNLLFDAIQMDLLSAVKARNASAALKLIAKGADVSTIDGNGDSSLHRAAWNTDVAFISVMEALIANGAAVDARNSSNCTPLHIASSAVSVSAIEFLATKGADINAVDNFGMTPLLCVVTKRGTLGATQAIAMLLMFGAEVKAVDLHFAASSCPVAVIKVLLANGADVNTLATNGSTPLDNTMCSPLDPVAVCLVAEGGKLSGKL